MAHNALGHSEFTVIRGTEAWAMWQHGKDFAGKLKHGYQRECWIRWCLTSLPYMWLFNDVEPVVPNFPGHCELKIDELTKILEWLMEEKLRWGNPEQYRGKKVPTTVHWKSKLDYLTLGPWENKWVGNVDAGWIIFKEMLTKTSVGRTLRKDKLMSL